MRLSLITTLCAATVLASSAFAQSTGSTPEDKPLAAPPAQSTAVTTPASGSAQGMIISIDPLTGRMRAPDAADLATLRAAQPKRAALPATSVRANPNGGHTATLDDSFGSYMVATKNADGSVHLDCLPSATAAATAVAKGVQVGQPRPRNAPVEK